MRVSGLPGSACRSMGRILARLWPFLSFFLYFVLVVLSDVSCLFSFPPPTELLSETVEARGDSGAEKERGLGGWVGGGAH
jgi:hypothetical protein